ncbi:MAG TPA: STAS domain-containing protein [Acidobacteriaceae bacterium]|jgi:anti-anti-sigma factor|nr:STAS domain-containing protein [Acidobacteriaceae bacterium]
MQTETRTTIDHISAPSGQSVTVLRFSGDISSSSREAVLGAWQNVTSGPVLLDFSKVDYINSSGIALVIQMLMEADKTGRKVAAFGLTPHFQKVFTMVGIAKYAGLYKDEATAAASL